MTTIPTTAGEAHIAVILLVVEDPATRAFLADNLSADGYAVHATDELAAATMLAANHHPDVAIVDVNAGAGLRFARAVRAERAGRVSPGLALIMLGSQGGELETLRSFEAGADDYLPKPFSYPELRARTEALLRRCERTRRAQRLRVGKLTIDVAQRLVTVAGRRVELTAKEFALLGYLAQEPTRVATKEELLKKVWGFRSLGQTRTLDSHACRLRHKLAGAGAQRMVINVWGVGYRLIDPPLEGDDPAPLAARAQA